MASYESRLLLALLLTPCLAHADAFGALGYAQTVAGLLVLGILILVGVGAVLVRRPRQQGLHYLLGLPLLLSGDLFLNHPTPEHLTLLLFVLLLNGLDWVRSFLPTAVRGAGLLAIVGAGVSLLGMLLAH